MARPGRFRHGEARQYRSAVERLGMVRPSVYRLGSIGTVVLGMALLVMTWNGRAVSDRLGIVWCGIVRMGCDRYGSHVLAVFGSVGSARERRGSIGQDRHGKLCQGETWLVWAVLDGNCSDGLARLRLLWQLWIVQARQRVSGLGRAGKQKAKRRETLGGEPQRQRVDENCDGRERPRVGCTGAAMRGMAMDWHRQSMARSGNGIG